MTARRWLLGWLLFALVCAQSLGFVHRVVHGAGSWGAPEVHADDVSQPAAAAASGLDALFAHDKSGLGCRLFDGVGQCGVAPHPALAAPALPAALLALPLLATIIPQARPSPFHARAPPVSR